MKIAIIGTGGVGGFFGAKLALAGNDVTFLARGAHLEAILANGLTVKSIDGDFYLSNPKATDKISEMGVSDLIIIGLKAWQIKDVRDEIKMITHAGSFILPLQNGIMAAEELSEVVPAENVIGGLCRIMSKVDGPAVINHFGVKPSIVFGALLPSQQGKLGAVKDCFDRAGFESKISDDIPSELWKKFILICVSGLVAITRTTYGELREVKETRQLMVDLLQEIYDLSQKVGVNIKADFVAKTVAFIDTYPYDSSTSMARDVWEGKPSEIEYQNGTVVKLAEKYGLDVPVNKFVYHCILPMEMKARGMMTRGTQL